jgi:hypothetical protein
MSAMWRSLAMMAFLLGLAKGMAKNSEEPPLTTSRAA